MKIYLVSILMLLLLSCSSNEKKEDKNTVTENDATGSVMNRTKEVKRFGMLTGIKPDKIEYYKKLHAAVWPGVLKQIKKSNIQNYSIYLRKIKNDYYLFSYFEYTGNNFDADMKNMAADTTTQRWWKETAPLQVPLPEAAAKGETWTTMEEVFHQE